MVVGEECVVHSEGDLAGRLLIKRLMENRGIDIEQMIALAKGVTTWDDWSVGLEKLGPY